MITSYPPVGRLWPSDDDDDDDDIQKSREIVKFSGVYVNDDISELVNDENEGCLLTIEMGGNSF